MARELILIVEDNDKNHKLEPSDCRLPSVYREQGPVGTSDIHSADHLRFDVSRSVMRSVTGVQSALVACRWRSA